MLSNHRRRTAARLCALAAALPLASLAAPVTVRIEGASGEPNGQSVTPAVAADGRHVVFASSATNFDPLAESSLYLHDLAERTVTALVPDANDGMMKPSISADGRYVAFESAATNLTSEMDSSFADVYLLDRESGAVELVSRGFGFIAPNSRSINAAVSGDGRFVAFTSLANNLVAPTTTASREHVYFADRTTGGLVELVTRSPDTSEEGDKPAEALEPTAYSRDGTRLVFTTAAENIAPVNAGNSFDVFVMRYDPTSRGRSYEMVNRGADGTLGNLSSSRGSISPNGRYVVFRTGANNILPPNGSPSDFYVRDLASGTLVAVPLPPGYGSCVRARVADDADVLMQCAPVTGNGTAEQVFFIAGATGTPVLASAAIGGAPGAMSSGQGLALDASGDLAAFSSFAPDLVAGDTNGASDVFLRAEPGVLDRLFADGFE